MKCHSDFVPGKKYNAPKYEYTGYLCIGHKSDGTAILETPKYKVLILVETPDHWQPEKQVHVRYVTMYPEGPGGQLFKTEGQALRCGNRSRNILGAAKVTIEWSEE